MRDKISIQLCFRKKRNTGIIRENAVYFRFAFPVAAQISERLHREEMRAYNGIIAFFRDKIIKLCGVAYICKIDGRCNACGAEHGSRMIHHAEKLWCL